MAAARCPWLCAPSRMPRTRCEPGSNPAPGNEGPYFPAAVWGSLPMWGRWRGSSLVRMTGPPDVAQGARLERVVEALAIAEERLNDSIRAAEIERGRWAR